MTTVVLGAAGAVVGYFLGGPLGASIGWSLGAALGSALEPKKGVEGPRLTDLHVQNSQYGLMIPIAYGTVRISGNVIWQTDLIEHKHTTSGKGGGPKVSSYTYSASFATMLCEGPILGVSRIWANKRLVWSNLNGTEEGDLDFTLYYGTATQLPDPTIEADKGVGHVPGHRGFAYLVFPDMPLEAYGNAIPSIECEVIATQNASLQRVNTWTPSFPNSGISTGAINGVEYDGTYIYKSYYSSHLAGPCYFFKDKYTFDGTFVENVVTLQTVTGNPAGDHGIFVAMVANSNLAIVTSNDASNTSIFSYWFQDGAQITIPIDVAPGATSVPNNAPAGVLPFYHNGYVYAIGDGPAYIARWDAPGGTPTPTISAYYFLDADTGGAASYIGFGVTADTAGYIWVMGTATFGAPGPLWQFDADLNKLAFWPENTSGLLSHLSESWTVYNNYHVFRLATTLYLFKYSGGVGGTFTQVDTYAISSPVYYADPIDLGGGYFMTDTGVFKIPQPVTLKTIIDDISDRCGLVSGEYFTDNQTQIVNGYVIGQQADGRGCLEPLMTAYQVDAVESGPEIKFVNKGAAPTEAIPDDDLAAYEESEKLPALISQIRTQEVDLPRSIGASYFNIDADYQIGTQLARREVTQSLQDMAIAFPIVFSDREAKQVVDTLLYDAWTKRRRFQFSTSRKWSKLEPTDVISVGGYTVMITSRQESQSGVLKFDAVATRSQVFFQGSKGAPSVGFTPPAPKTTQLTQLVMLDLPLINETDYPNGPYAAMAGVTDDTWGSAELFKSVDGGTTYGSLLTNSVADVIGVASTILGDFASGNVFDNVNSVTVVIGNGGGTLSSASRLAVLNGTHRAVIGNEIIGFMDATLIATSTYVLTGLLRGRFGTEWAMSTHGADETFVMLPTSTNVNGAFGELGLARKYKAVTSGTTLAMALAHDFTNTGVALRPYPPTHLGGGRNAGLDIILQWTRRTRIGGSWADYTDVPLSEVVEKYYVTVYGDATYTTLKYSFIVIGATTVTFTLSQQIGSFGSGQPVIYWSVAQAGAYVPSLETRAIT